GGAVPRVGHPRSDMTQSGSVLALDAGQTGIKVRLTRAGADPVERLFAGVLTDQPILPPLAAVARETASGVPVDTIAVGTSGLTSAEEDAGMLRTLVHELAPSRVLLTHDSVTYYLGTLGDGYGAVVAAGT